MVSFSFILFLFNSASKEQLEGKSHNAFNSILYYFVSSFVGYIFILASYMITTSSTAGLFTEEFWINLISVTWHFGILIKLGAFPVIFIVPKLVEGGSSGGMLFLLVISKIIIVIAYTKFIPLLNQNEYSYYMVITIIILTMIITMGRILNTVVIWEMIIYSGLNSLSLVIWILYISTIGIKMNSGESKFLIYTENLFWIWIYMVSYSVLVIITIGFFHTFFNSCPLKKIIVDTLSGKIYH